MIVSIENLGFHCTKVHWLCDDAVVARSNALCYWKCKKSIGIFPTKEMSQQITQNPTIIISNFTK